MPRKKKDAHIITMKLATPVYNQLEKFCAETGVSKTDATEKILSLYFDEFYKRSENERKLNDTFR